MSEGVRWIPLWEQDAPEEEDVVVKVALDTGFGVDIGRRYLSGWKLQFYEKSRPVAWARIPKP
jgi:hypothetical protein